MMYHEIVVIGGGPAGLAAACAAYDAGARDVVILDREDGPGGILRQCIHPGFGLHRLGEELTGPEYAAVFTDMVRRRGIPVHSATTVTALTGDREITCTGPEGIRHIRAGAVVLAMGCRERSRGALAIPGTRPAGVYTAGTAQKMVNTMGLLPGKRVVILGSGDIGLIMARRMTLEGAQVACVCELLPYSGGLIRNIVQCLEDFEIPLYLSTTVTAIHGEKRVEAVTLSQVDENRRPIPGTERRVECDTLLLSCGLIPENELSRMAGAELDPVTGGPVVDERRETTVPGVFACGNVLHVHDLVDYVSREAEMAGAAAAAFVQGNTGEEDRVCSAAGEGVRCVVPQRLSCLRGAELYFRASRPMGPCRALVMAGERCLVKKSLLRAAPGEMETLRLPPDAIAEGANITVCLEELRQ